MKSLQPDVRILKKVVLQGCPFENANVGPKVQVLEPKCFS